MNYNEDDEARMQEALEEEAKTGAGARAFEDWLAGPYKEEWHKVWESGRQACTEGKGIECNPHKLKVWKEVWQYGWDNYDPNPPSEFRQAEANINTLPTRPMNENDY